MSMLRARFLLLGALAVLATSALAAASTLGAPPASRTAGRAVPAAGIPLALTSAAPVTADQSLYLPLIAAPRAHGPTRVTTTTITIPTHVYEPALSSVYVPAYNMSYPRLDRSRYDPAAVENRDYTLVNLENDYLALSLMPQLGGRIYQVVDKTSGNHLFYQNPVIKPSPWGPAEMGWWLAVGGVEWCLPVEEHGYEWGVPWGYQITTDAGGATVTLWDTQASDRLRAHIAVSLRDDEALFHIAPAIENPTAQPIDFKFWLNAMLDPGTANAPSANLRFIMPADQATVHSTGDPRLPGAGQGLSWPVYNGVDWSRLGNWRQWFGFFQRPQASGGFQAVYDESSDAGVVRTYDGSVATGAKFFGFGWSQAIPPSNYTDDDSAYVEMHGGVAPTFADSRQLGAGQSLTWEERWYPVAHLGGLTWANANVALRVHSGGGQTVLSVVTNRDAADVHVMLLRRAGSAVLFDQPIALLGAGQVYQSPPISTPGLGGADVAVQVTSGGILLGEY